VSLEHAATSGTPYQTGQRIQFADGSAGAPRALDRMARLEAWTARIRRYNADVEPHSDRFRAAILLLAALEIGHNVDALARFTRLDRAFVAKCARRLIDNGVWSGGRTVADWTADDEASGAFWNDVAVAEGKLNRRASADGVLEWAPAGVWRKTYGYAAPSGPEEGPLGTVFHDAVAAPDANPASVAPADARREDVPAAASAGAPADDAAESVSERPERPAPKPPAAPRSGSFEDVFGDVVWIR
jgi:hypothetical protein